MRKDGRERLAGFLRDWGRAQGLDARLMRPFGLVEGRRLPTGLSRARSVNLIELTGNPG